MHDIPVKAVTLNSGIELNYVRHGNGPVLIFIHGATGDFGVWQPQWGVFTQHFDCIAYSRRYSQPNRNELTASDHSALVDANDLQELIQLLNIDEAILVGSSYGGFTALALACSDPTGILALVSVEAPMWRYADTTEAGGKLANAFRQTALIPAKAAFERGNNEQGMRLLTGGILGRDPAQIPAEVIKKRMHNLNAARSLCLSEDAFPWLSPATLANLSMPVLLIRGANTAAVHAATFNAVAAAMPQAQTLVVDGSEHSVSQLKPDAFNAQVLRFLIDSTS